MVKILLLEDDPHYREVIERVLWRTAPYAVKAVSTEQQAWEILSETDFDLVLLDLNIGGRKCWETLSRVAKLPARPPAIVFSCEDTRGNADYAVSHGAYAFLPKPFSFVRLQMTIESALRSRNRPGSTRPAGCPE